MSILAHITVVQCDDCERLETLSNDVERETFEKLWLRTHSKDFCFLCREKREAVRPDGEAMDRAISKMVRKYGAAEVISHG
jgi:hypothetical protein